jgi:hypothetical protein
MGVLEAKIQTVEDIYRLIWTAASHKQPVRAMYKDLPRRKWKPCWGGASMS